MDINQLLNIDNWIIKFFIIIIIIILINLFTRLVLNTLRKQFSKTNNIWDDCVINSIYRPLTMLVWILGVVFTLEAFNNDIKYFSISNDALISIKKAGIILVIALFILNISKNFQQAIIINNKKNK